MGRLYIDGVLFGVIDEAKYAASRGEDLSDEAQDRYALEGTRIVNGREVPEIVPRRLAPFSLRPRTDQEPT